MCEVKKEKIFIFLREKIYKETKKSINFYDYNYDLYNSFVIKNKSLEDLKKDYNREKRIYFRNKKIYKSTKEENKEIEDEFIRVFKKFLIEYENLLETNKLNLLLYNRLIF